MGAQLKDRGEKINKTRAPRGSIIRDHKMFDDKSRFLMYELCDDSALKRKRPKTKLCKINKTLQKTNDNGKP